MFARIFQHRSLLNASRSVTTSRLTLRRLNRGAERTSSKACQSRSSSSTFGGSVAPSPTSRAAARSGIILIRTCPIEVGKCVRRSTVVLKIFRPCR